MRVITQRVVWGGIAAVVFLAGAARAQSQIVTMGIDGNLNRGHVAYMRAAIDKMRGDTLPTGFIIVVDSAGGDGKAAMEMGRDRKSTRLNSSHT